MHSIDYTISREDEDFDIEVEYTVAPFIRGNSYGPPEHCEPDSGGEVEDLDAFHDGKPFALTDAEREQIEQYIYGSHDYE